MVDAATNDLLPIIQTVSSTCSSDSSAKLSPADNCKSNEDSGPPRCLSPVLNSNNSHRKLIYNRKRGRSKSRIKLTKRFSSPHDTNTEHDKIQGEIVSDSFSGYEDYINKALSDFQSLKSDQVEDRLAKIRQFEKEKRKFLDSLYVPKETKTYVSDRVFNISDEFNFKKPVSPVSGAKKCKPSVDVFSQDRKTVHNVVINFSERHAEKQDLNNYTESNEENIRNENQNIKEGDLKFRGFCTGSGKNIIISPESLRKNVEIFGDILDINKVTPHIQNPNSCSDTHIETFRKENVFQQFVNKKSSLAKDCAVNETVDKHKLHNLKELSFMQTSMSDTQLILAADVALSMMDDNLLVAPSSTNKIGGSTLNDCDVIELEKTLSTSIENNPKMVGNNSKNYNNDKKFTNASKVERNNKKITAESCVGYQVSNILNEKISSFDEENVFRGFAIDEYNYAQPLCNKHSKCVKIMENVIECCTNLMVNKNKETNIPIISLGTNQSNSNHLQQITDAGIFDRNGKHALSNMWMIPSKRFKFDHSKNDNFETDIFDCGFKTASKKPIKMLPSSMKNAQCIYEQVCQTDNTVGGGLVDTHKVTKKEVSLTNTLEPTKSSAVSETINKLTVLSFESPKSDFIDMSEYGFKTASKKPIKMLPSSMKNAQHIYEQICQTENPADWTVQTNTITEIKENTQPRDVSSAEFTNVQKISKSKVIPQILNNNTRASKEEKFGVNSDELSGCGFKTASKKPIKMLPSSIKNAQNMYEQICKTENPADWTVQTDTITEIKENAQSRNVSSAEFTNIRKKISESKVIPQILNNNTTASKEEKFGVNSDEFSGCGFKTASKKPIKMLPSSIKNAQNMYEQICKTENPADWTVQTDTIAEIKENTQSRDVSSAEFTNVRKKIAKSKVIPQILNNNITTASKEAKFGVNSDEFSGCGFKTASKKPIKMLPSSLKKAQNIFENIDMAENLTECNEINKDEFLRKSGEVNLKNSSPTGFATACGKTIKISDNAWHKASSVFADDEMSSASLIQNHELDDDGALGFNLKSSTSKQIPKISNVSRNCGLVPVEEEGGSSTCAAGFTTGSGTKIKISKSALQKSETLFADEVLSSSTNRKEVKDLIEATVSDGLQKTNKVHYDNHFLKQDNNEKQDISSFPECYHGSAMSKNPNPVNSKHKFFDSPMRATKIAKKRLGLSACKQILIPNDKLQKAKSILEEDSDSNQSGGSRNVSVGTPIRFKQAEIHSSTPSKEVGAFKNVDFEKIIKAATLDNTDITPVKKPYLNENIETKNVVSENKNKSAIFIQERTESDIKKRLEQFNNEYEDLAYRMKVISDRKRALEIQEQLIKNADDTHRRQKPSILSVQKKSLQKISLKELCGNRKPGSVYCASDALALDVPRQVLEVTSKNAKHVHFNYNWKNNGEKYSSTVCTADGAVVIPNAGDFISLTEISTAFEAMPGVDPRLLPKEWISNHFKWIVWKLASLQKNFPDLFTNCLSIENVMQQLKYRYDREIDQAERPALRRILEKDDIPQKRMILCVSDIIEVSHNMFELELTDGWYCIQTFIDQPLCKQIVAAKIVIGTKLIVQCAEILNCDGCHPLEVPSNVKLKINYNCTRRAAWYSKLGYQRIAEPFPIPLRTINSDGGAIAVVKVYIARAYPLRYMERQAGKTVWRNKKAEDKRAQEWSNARMKEMEMMHQKVQEDYEREINSAQKNMLGRVDCSKISEISSPKLLYQMLESTNDPEGFKNMMSSAQIASAMEYRSNIYAHHQQEVASRIEKQIKNLKSSNRDVTAVLKLRILDGSECSEDSFIFNIWKPTEEHLHVLKEGCMFSVYNVLPKANGDLAANSRTHFKPETPLPLSNNEIQRHIVTIGMVQHSANKPRFNEYDTVGTVVQTHKDVYYQDLWLTDSVGRLLHVHIREGPEQCCLLDNLNRGQGIAVMNLIFRRPHDAFGQALANQCTVITGYPQHKFLQNGLIEHCAQLPKDLASLLNKCDKEIEVCMANMHIARNTSSLYGPISTSGSVADVFDDSSEDNTLIPSRLTTTDVAMSLIDTDQFL